MGLHTTASDRALALNALLLARDAHLQGAAGAERRIGGLCERLAHVWRDDRTLAAAADAVGASQGDALARALDRLIGEVRLSRCVTPSACGAVLLVDDDPAIRAVLEMIARPYAREIHAVASMAEALRVAERERLCAVVLDLSLPDGDGRDLLVRLRDEPVSRRVPVLILTGSEDPLDTAECLALGAQEVHRKPIDPVTLAGAVSVMMGFEARTSLELAGDALTGLAGPEVVRSKAADCVEQFYALGDMWCVISGTAGSDEGAIRALADLVRPAVEAAGGAATRDRHRITMVLPRTTAAGAEQLCTSLRAILPTANFGISESGQGTWAENQMTAKRLLVLAGQAGGVVASEAPHLSIGRPRLIVVDDDPTVAALIEVALKQDGIDVVALDRGDRLVESVRLLRPTAILLDVNLPGPDGLELLRALRAEPGLPRVPVVLLTSHTDARYVESAFASGADDFISKPFDPRAVRARILRLTTKAP